MTAVHLLPITQAGPVSAKHQGRFLEVVADWQPRTPQLLPHQASLKNARDLPRHQLPEQLFITIVTLAQV